MENFTVLAKVIWYFDNEKREECIVLTDLSSLTEAMGKIESYYGKDVVSVELTATAYPFFDITPECYDEAMNEAI